MLRCRVLGQAAEGRPDETARFYTHGVKAVKTGFTQDEIARIGRAKAIVRRLIKGSGMNQQALLARLAESGLVVKQSAFSNWLSPNYPNVRPKQEFLEPLIALCCAERSPAQRQEILDEINLLLGYTQGPMTPELVHNSVAGQLEDPPESLRAQQDLLAHHLSALDALLDLIEPRVMDYGRYHPVIRLESEERNLARQLLGDDKASYREFEVEDGYEIPLTRIQSLDAIVRIIDELNEGARLLQRYLDRHLNEPEGLEHLDGFRVDDYISYAWEISDRLLHHNRTIRAVPALKRALLRQMTTCFGVRYVLENLSGESSEIAFQNVLAIKARDFEFDIHCSVAVFVGMLARRLLRQGSEASLARGLRLYRRASEWLARHHGALGTEQEIYHYKKELANLHYDLANFALPQQARVPGFEAFFATAMSTAAQHYREVLESENLFVQGLSPSRLAHLQVFYTLARCWSEPQSKAEQALAALSEPAQLDESYWTYQIARAVGFAILAHRGGKGADGWRRQAGDALARARLVDGFAARTDQEMAAEYVLSRLSPELSRGA